MRVNICFSELEVKVRKFEFCDLRRRGGQGLTIKVHRLMVLSVEFKVESLRLRF